MITSSLNSLIDVYRRVLGDDLPADATANDVSMVLTWQSPATLKLLDQALAAAGVDQLLANLETSQTDESMAWDHDDRALVFRPEQAGDGSAYLRQMLAKGVAQGPVETRVEFDPSPFYPAQMNPLVLGASQLAGGHLVIEGMTELDALSTQEPLQIVIRPMTAHALDPTDLSSRTR